MTNNELKLKREISRVVTHFISVFPREVRFSKEHGAKYIHDLQLRDREIIRGYLELYMNEVDDVLHEEHAKELLGSNSLHSITASIYRLMKKYTIRSKKRMNAQYEEVYGKK